MKYKAYIKEKLKREPNEFELHLFSATYSEHCGYLHSKELLKELPRDGAIYPTENAGGIKIGSHAILFKTESHNHPCAVEPFNGAATGIGGIVRDVLAMNARPIALCNSLKFGKKVIEGVIEGISYYGNCIGVPTVSTEVLQNDAFENNPIVNVTCIGITEYDKILTSNNAKIGQKLMLVGSHTMKDGLHGASFASKKLSGDKNKLSIQIANPFMKKKLIEACLEIFSKNLVTTCQDCGAAGILSSTSEVAYKSQVGVEIDLSKIHIGDNSIKDFEIMLSETQERMLFVTDKENEISKILKKYEIPYSIIGKVTANHNYIVKNNNKILANLPVELLVTVPKIEIDFTLSKLKDYKLNSINTKSIYERYDHTVGARTQTDPNANPQFNSLWLYEENCSLGIYTFSSTVKTTYNKLIDAAKFLKSKGYNPLGITNCLNFANPEIAPTMYEFKKTIQDIKHACQELEIPVCSGNVSFYNESQTSSIINIPTFTMLGVKPL